MLPLKHTELLSRYSEPHRGYHTLEHITNCLEALERHSVLAHDKELIELALWYHDAVYDPRAPSPNNESDSALLFIAGEIHRLSPSRVFAGMDLIMATASHFDPTFELDDGDTKLMMDIDLVGFATGDQTAITAGIRKEYAHVPETDYNKGRLQLMNMLLARPRIYRTDEFHALYEARARANIEAQARDLNARLNIEETE